MEFNIGDRVIVKDYTMLPENVKTKGLAKMCGEAGTVTDKMLSQKSGEYLYTIKFDNFERSMKLWSGELLELFCDGETAYCHEFEYLNNVVIAKFYEIKGNVKTELGRGHGHIIHQGALGIAQAASYALKKLYENMNGGSLKNN